MAEGLDRQPPDSRYWRADALGGVDCFAARFTTHRYARHWHDGYALGVVVHGAERFTCNGREWHAAPLATIIAINPGEVHDGASAGPSGWAYRMAYPSVDVLTRVAASLTGRAVAPTLRRSAIDDPELARRFVACHERMDLAPDRVAREQALWAWLADLVMRHADLSVAGAPELDATDARLRRVRDLIDASPAADLSLEALAAVAGLGPHHLVRSFARAFGMTPHAWQIQRRLVRARRLIDRGLPLAEVAARAGFCDQSHLADRFRRAYGVTPGAYRRAATRAGAWR
ncbi:MAG: AraC family ligand binding domain-containing protein [Vicinamibacterales bacterium]